MAKCHRCGLRFTRKDLINASKGLFSPVGDWNWICYVCQFSMLEDDTWNNFKQDMIYLHGGGKCEHQERIN